MSKYKISIITTCKGRLHHLKNTIFNNINQITEHSYEAIVVDYGCPDNTYEYVESLNNSIIKAIRVTENAEVFNVSRARNIGAVNSSGEYLLFVDVDWYIPLNFIDIIIDKMEEGFDHSSILFNYADGSGAHLISNGLFCINRDIFFKLRGYDESFEGWGSEDTDMVNRAKHHYPNFTHINGMIGVIEHSDEERTKHYCVKNKWESDNNNKKLMDVDRFVNPGGYGGLSDKTSKICVIQASDYNHIKLLEVSGYYNKLYCCKYNWDYKQYLLRDNEFIKFARVDILINEIEKQEYDWVMWLDSDAAIHTQEDIYSLLLHKYSDKAFLFCLGADENSWPWDINSGVFFANIKHEKTKDIALKWLQQKYVEKCDQHALQNILKQEMEKDRELSWMMNFRGKEHNLFNYHDGKYVTHILSENVKSMEERISLLKNRCEQYKNGQ